MPARYADLLEAVVLAPTLLDACGLPPYLGMQGDSILPWLQTKVEGHMPGGSIYCEYYNAMPLHTLPSAQLTMLRTERYKIVVDHAHSEGELYDLRSDPLEIQNLWGDAGSLPLKVKSGHADPVDAPHGLYCGPATSAAGGVVVRGWQIYFSLP